LGAMTCHPRPHCLTALSVLLTAAAAAHAGSLPTAAELRNSPDASYVLALVSPLQSGGDHRIGRPWSTNGIMVPQTVPLCHIYHPELGRADLLKPDELYSAALERRTGSIVCILYDQVPPHSSFSARGYGYPAFRSPVLDYETTVGFEGVAGGPGEVSYLGSYVLTEKGRKAVNVEVRHDLAGALNTLEIVQFGLGAATAPRVRGGDTPEIRALVRPWQLRYDLFKGVYANDTRAVTEALDRGADIKALGPVFDLEAPGAQRPTELHWCDDSGQPLHAAAYLGRLEVLRTLLDRGADGAAPAGDRGHQYTPVDLAALGGHRECLTLLVERGAAVEVETLVCAARAGHTEEMAFLLGKGVRPNDLDGDGQTSLHAAVAAGQLASVQFLLTNGADVNAKDKRGKTPLQLALQLGRWLRSKDPNRDEIVTLLKQHGAR
jgi:hypothetical protein